MRKYNNRKWLNKKKSPSTGSITAFCNKGVLTNGKKGLNIFLAISDCNHVVKLRKSHGDSSQDFINKLGILKSTISDFIIFLEENKNEIDEYD